MPFTVITVTNVPQSLRGDLSKWMQEIAVGVYVGNFNSRVREQLWKRVCANTAQGEATLSFATRNECGYQFETYNTRQEVIDSDGLPLVRYPIKSKLNEENSKYGFSKAQHNHMIRVKEESNTRKKKTSENTEEKAFVIVHVLTDELDVRKAHITEIGAVKISGNKNEEFQEIIQANGTNLITALEQLVLFVGECTVVCYDAKFEINIIQTELSREDKSWKPNQYIDLLDLVRKEKLFLENYKLATVISSYGIDEEVQNHVKEDIRLLVQLISKLKGFTEKLK